ncbi:MAG TPA: ComEA family DNA-binding protein [Thermoleophilaceae bacterium]|nr:ComEA family DNA-binding protein [Thermoleophilaceae bacterium]
MFEEGRSRGFVWVVAAALVLAVGYRLLGDRPPESPPVTVEGAGAREPRAGPSRGARLYVHVAGAVRRPGLYRVREGARVAAALHLAGGPKPKADLTSVNLAARVQDGQQVVVPKPGAAPPPATAGTTGTAAGSGSGPISLAAATQAQLEELDGIGPTLAGRILEYRDENGGFRSVEELAEVDGIGEVRLEALREAVQP